MPQLDDIIATPGSAAVRREVTIPVNVQPCRVDPVFGLLKDRWRLSPVAAGGLALLLYFVVSFLLCLASGTVFPKPGLDLPFGRDYARMVFNIILVPVGMALTMRFYAQIEVTFERLLTDRVIRASDEEYEAFLKKLDRRYNSIALHVIVFLTALSLRLYGTYVINRDGIDEWVDLSHGLSAYYHLIVNIASWYMALLLVCKAIITARAIRKVFDWPVNVQPFHPDGCGGLLLLTEISITLVLCLGLASMGVVTFIWLGQAAIMSLTVLLATILIIATPIVFMTCIYGAHRAMLQVRQSLLQHINQHVHPSYQTLCNRLAAGDLTHEAAESVLQLEALHALLRRLPVWPVNTQSLAQVVVSIAVPFILLVVQMILEHSVGAK